MVKVPSSRFQQFLCPFTMLFVEGYSEAEFFRHLSNPLFQRRYFRKSIGYDRHLLVENVENLMEISEMRRKIEKKKFFSEIIVSELVPLNCIYSEENTCHR